MADDPDEVATEHALDEAPTTPGDAVAPGPGVEDRPYDPSEDRERKRGQIALVLVWLLVGIVAGAFLLLVGKAVCLGAGGTIMCDSFEIVEIRTLIEIVLTPVVGLVGAVTGFYFGEKKG